MDWIYVAQDKDKGLAQVNTVMSVLIKARSILNSKPRWEGLLCRMFTKLCVTPQE